MQPNALARTLYDKLWDEHVVHTEEDGTILPGWSWFSMKPLIALLLMAGILVFSGCNTIKGVGQDIQKAGSVIEGAARKN